MESKKFHITKCLMLLIFSAFYLFVAISVNAQQSAEELPKSLGIYLSTMEGLVKCPDITLRHIIPDENQAYYGYRNGRYHTTLGDWNSPNVSSQKLSIIVYFTIGSRDPEKIKLYRLQAGKDIYPFITPIEEIKFSSVEPITSIPGAALGNMVRLIPENILTKGNYVIVENNIDNTTETPNNKVDRCWGFKVDNGEKIWRTPSSWEKCCAYICSKL